MQKPKHYKTFEGKKYDKWNFLAKAALIIHLVCMGFICPDRAEDYGPDLIAYEKVNGVYVDHLYNHEVEVLVGWKEEGPPPGYFKEDRIFARKAKMILELSSNECLTFWQLNRPMTHALTVGHTAFYGKKFKEREVTMEKGRKGMDSFVVWPKGTFRLVKLRKC